MNLYSLTRKQLENILTSKGFSSHHAVTLFKHLYRSVKRPLSIQQLFSLPTLPKSLSEECIGSSLGLPQIHSLQKSDYDQSIKFLIQLTDKKLVETVLMPEKKRITLCISTQVGCAQGCVFCHTGRMGLQRHLKVDEMIGQFVVAQRWIKENPNWLELNRLSPETCITNIVFMGMGEPLDNVDNLCNAVEILIDPQGLGIGPRKITVSTAGHLDGLKTFFARHKNVSLALSLHSIHNKERSRLMPINRKFPIDKILDFLRQNTFETTKRSIMIQYTVMKGVNDSLEDCAKIAEMLKGIPAKINLIPLNPISASRLEDPDPDHLRKFQNSLKHAGIFTTIRFSKGQDISGACGQLITQTPNFG